MFEELTNKDLEYLLCIKDLHQNNLIKKIQITKTLNLKRPTVTHQINKLIKLGYLTQESHHIVKLTQKCINLFMNIEYYQEKIIDVFIKKLNCQKNIAKMCANILIKEKNTYLLNRIING